MMVTYIMALVLIGFVIVCSCVVSLKVNRERTFKKRQRVVKRSRGAVITSPRLQEAIFAMNERYQAFRGREAEVEPEI